MREAVRAKKMKIHEDAADRAAGQKLLEMAGANLTVAVPEAALDRAADNEMKLLTQRLSRSGISMEQHCKNSRTTADALRAGYRADAERKIRTMYAARAIAEAEGITVRTEEVNNEYRRLSVQQDTPEARYPPRAHPGDGGRRPRRPEGPALFAGQRRRGLGHGR